MQMLGIDVYARCIQCDGLRERRAPVRSWGAIAAGQLKARNRCNRSSAPGVLGRAGSVSQTAPCPLRDSVTGQGTSTGYTEREIDRWVVICLQKGALARPDRVSRPVDVRKAGGHLACDVLDQPQLRAVQQ
jgi:hypothetical protein